tara:strand:+ start:5146 stop:5433 length:288 start_codon:yes stop_codon:yes gene_type:complete
MLNFNDLPTEIKQLIFKENRITAMNEHYKNNFKDVIEEINYTSNIVWDELSMMDDYLETDILIGNYILDEVTDARLQLQYEIQLETQLDYYLEHG